MKNRPKVLLHKVLPDPGRPDPDPTGFMIVWAYRMLLVVWLRMLLARIQPPTKLRGSPSASEHQDPKTVLTCPLDRWTGKAHQLSQHSNLAIRATIYRSLRAQNSKKKFQKSLVSGSAKESSKTPEKVKKYPKRSNFVCVCLCFSLFRVFSGTSLQTPKKSPLVGTSAPTKKYLAPPSAIPQFAALPAPRPLPLLETPLLRFSIKNRTPPPAPRTPPPSPLPEQKKKKKYPKRSPRDTFLNSVHARCIVKTCGFTRGVCKKPGIFH